MRLTSAAANAKVQAVVDQLANGYLRFYSGAAAPADANDPVPGGAVLMSEHRFQAPAAPAAVAGVATFNGLTVDNNIRQNGTLLWARALRSDGITPVLDLTVIGLPASGAEVIVDTVSVLQGRRLRVLSFSYTQPR